MNPTLLYILAVVFAGVAISSGWLLFRYGTAKIKIRSRKALAYALVVVHWVAWFLDYTAIEETVALNINSPFGDKPLVTLLTILMLWFTICIGLLAVMYAFYQLPSVRNILKYVGVPLFVLDFVALSWHITAITGGEGGTVNTIRSIALTATYAMALALCLSAWADTPRIKLSGRKTFKMFAWLLGALLVSWPAYLPKGVFGYVGPTRQLEEFNLHHRLLLYACAGIALVMFLVLRRRPQKVKHFALLYISLATLITFSLSYPITRYSTPDWMIRLPLHLCNTAMYIVPLCLLFRMKRLYYFTFLVNVLGSFFAMFMPNYDVDHFFTLRILIFWINHFIAAYMPLLMMALGEFERPKLRHFFYALTGFSGYYVLVLICNAWFSNYGNPDFFFINSDFIAEKLGVWAENVRDITFTFKISDLKFTLYPLYQLFFFLGYVLMTVGMWFLYEQLFTIGDSISDMGKRKEKIKLEQLALMSQLEGRSEEEPLFMESVNSLVLTHLTKRYGKSDVYAVHDANLEVFGGEIFGFLGPNGAGKSTIIKSIVGIQPITDGSIAVCGYDAERQPVQAKRQIGFVPDHYELYENLTGREYINYIADLYHVSREDRDTRIAHYVSLFMLQGAFDNPMKTYSHGMKQKIAIMAALVHNPRVWILDEPLTGLDPDSIFQVKECMKQHAAAGNIVFFSSHIIDVVERICDRIAIIRKGQILCTKTLAELEASGETLESFYMRNIEGQQTAQAVSVKPAVKGEAK